MKRITHLIAAFFLALIASGVAIAPAQAAYSADTTISTWNALYEVQADGTVHVVEELTYHFGSSSAHHGITRWLPVQESWSKDSSKVRTYDVTMRSVSANVSGTVTDYTTKTVTSSTDKNLKGVEYRIGSANAVVPAHVVTYTLTYDVKGLITEENGQAVAFIDFVPADINKTTSATITLRTPSGPVGEPICKVGAKDSGKFCGSTKLSDTSVSFSAKDLAGGSNAMSGGVTFPKLAGMDTSVHLADSASAAAGKKITIGGIGTIITAIGSFITGAWWKRRRGRDERFLGVPPGVAPAADQEYTIGRDNKPTIPVCFAPPRGVTPGEAGMLDDSIVDIRDTSATLVDLAVRGAIKIYADDEKNMRVQLQRPELATAAHEQALLQNIFAGVPLGQEVDLSVQGSMADAHEEVTAELRQLLDQRGWYKRMPGPLAASGAGGSLGCMGIIFGALMFFGSGLTALVTQMWWLLPLLPLAIVLMVISHWRSRGQRSAQGRAVADQIIGFREYMATAEADQIRFEEGEDIFSKYLPWAIIFQLTERWTTICQQLVAMGRISDAQPDWYYGPWSYGYFPGDAFDSTITDAMTVPSSDSGSGSDFGGGGWSGGDGGGGGGGGDW